MVGWYPEGCCIQERPLASTGEGIVKVRWRHFAYQLTAQRRPGGMILTMTKVTPTTMAEAMDKIER